MPTEQVISVQRIYNTRSSVYDDTWHPAFAGEYVKWTSPLPGQHILDLACGTGLVSLLAKQAVGESGTVMGIDVSDGMMDVARKKAERLNLDIKFINHDITDLEGLKGIDLTDDYDLITCATALVLLEDPAKAIKQWTGLLKPGGRLITDVPTEDANISGLVFEEVGEVLGIQLPFSRRWVENIYSLQQLMIKAGLEIECAIKHQGYNGPKDYGNSAGAELFDRSVPATKPQDAVKDLNDVARGLFVEKFGAPCVREKARAIFAERFKNRAGNDGIVREQDCFYVVIAKKRYG